MMRFIPATEWSVVWGDDGGVPMHGGVIVSWVCLRFRAHAHHWRIWACSIGLRRTALRVVAVGVRSKVSCGARSITSCGTILSGIRPGSRTFAITLQPRLLHQTSTTGTIMRHQMMSSYSFGLCIFGGYPSNPWVAYRWSVWLKRLCTV